MIKKIEQKEPVQLYVKEYFYTALDKDKQVYEDGWMEYEAVGIKTKEGMKLILPQSPQNNIDDMYEAGFVCVDARQDDNNPDYFSFGNRTIVIKEWKPVEFGSLHFKKNN